MGWKAFRDHYGISKHVVYLQGDQLVVASTNGDALAYISRNTGQLNCLPANGNALSAHYPGLMRSDPELNRLLLREPDHFTRSIVIFTFSGADILAKLCETPCWPNCTHEGQLITEERFDCDPATIIEKAIRHHQQRLHSIRQALIDGNQFMDTQALGQNIDANRWTRNVLARFNRFKQECAIRL